MIFVKKTRSRIRLHFNFDWENFFGLLINSVRLYVWMEENHKLDYIVNLSSKSMDLVGSHADSHNSGFYREIYVIGFPIG